MTIRHKERWIEDDTNVFGSISLRERFKGINPPVIKMDPNKKDPELDSVKIYPKGHQDAYGG